MLDPVLAWTAVENDLDLLSRIAWPDMVEMIYDFPVYFDKVRTLFLTGTGSKKIPEITDNSNSRIAFNQYGDNIFPRPANVMEGGYTPNSGFISVTMSENFIAYLNDFLSDIEEKNALFLLAAPPILKEDFQNHGLTEVDLVEFRETLEQNFEGEVISDFTDYIYPASYFYDTNFHLNETGKEIRTNQLIEDIIEWMAKS